MACALMASHGQALSNPALPRQAEIVGGDPADGRREMGNVKVGFSDRHAELWTREGRAMMPAVSSQGLVGWVVVTADNYLGMHLDNLLRVCWPNGRTVDFPIDMPFIEKWAFSRNGRSVVLQFRGTHGPENYVEYDILNGALLHQALDVMNDAVPAWADKLRRTGSTDASISADPQSGDASTPKAHSN